MLVAGITQAKETRAASVQTVQSQEKVQSQEVATGQYHSETGATVSISAEGLGLSQGSVIQKSTLLEGSAQIVHDNGQDEKMTALQEDYQKSIYQEMMESAKENAEAESKGFQDMAKALEIARRILDGDIVPSEDEQFLMEYDSELYMRVKSMARPKEDPKEYDTLLEEEEENKEESAGGASVDGSHIASNTSDFPSGSIEKMKVSQV